MEEQLQQLINLQREQNELLKKNLWRLRFSLLFLLLMTTALCFGLGFVAYQLRPTSARPKIMPLSPVDLSTVEETIDLSTVKEIRQEQVERLRQKLAEAGSRAQ